MAGDAKVWLAERAGPLLLRGLGGTLRIAREDEERCAAARAAGPGGVIFSLWHAHLLLLAYAMRDRGIHVLVSRHRDGELIARVLARLGSATVRGSSTRGGREALHALGAAARRGADLAITPDGPRGPARRVQPGVILAAQLTGLAIVPLAGAGPRDRRLGSWDRFRVPLPFSRVRVAFGEPLSVPRRAAPERTEELRRLLEERMRELAARVEGEPPPC